MAKRINPKERARDRAETIRQCRERFPKFAALPDDIVYEIQTRLAEAFRVGLELRGSINRSLKNAALKKLAHDGVDTRKQQQDQWNKIALDGRRDERRKIVIKGARAMWEANPHLSAIGIARTLLASSAFDDPPPKADTVAKHIAKFDPKRRLHNPR